MRSPDIQLDKDESRQLAEAAANVARHYDLEATQKTLDWSAFITCLAMVYGTRIFAYRARRAAARRADATEKAAYFDPTIVGQPSAGSVN